MYFIDLKAKARSLQNPRASRPQNPRARRPQRNRVS